MARFLDRLMIAESGGRDDARNPRSTALGPYQFIESTFKEVVARHFSGETEKLSQTQILALRTNRAFARRAAEAFTRDNAATLAAAGIEPTLVNLRLAFLVGPAGAIRLLTAPQGSLAIASLGAGVVQANPFMAGMTAADLAAWSARNLAAGRQADGDDLITVDPKRAARAARALPAIAIRCNQALPTCRRWVALARKRLGTRQAAADRANRR